MDTPRARSPRPLPPLSSKPTAPLPPPPPPHSSSGAASPSANHDFPFAFSSASSSPTFGGNLHTCPSSMSRAQVGRVGSDLSHISYSKASSRHPTTSYGSKDNRDRVKNKRTSPLFSGLSGAWRKEISRSSSSSDTTSSGRNKLASSEGKRRKDKAKSRAVDLGQWVKKYMAAMVEQLRSSFYRPAERGHHRRQRPHSFSGHGPNSAARETRERERWMRQRGQLLSSAPASLRVSPANSGHLSLKESTSEEESTMEELQSAIEAAIAHCKNSICRAQQADDDGRRGDRTDRLHQ